jgi:predicted secreted hydrolase
MLIAWAVISPARAQTSADTFRTAKPNYTWQFPVDHGRHQGFQTEWWYYTGHLYTGDAEPFRDKPRYGFQLTFFRRQDSPGLKSTSEYLAHAALTDLETGTTISASRKGGGLLGAAGADLRTLEVWSGDWSSDLIGATHALRFSPDKKGEIQVRLIGLSPTSAWLQGAEGYSKKGACESCASHYYSFARIPFTGEIRTPQGISSVHGLGWMDHEFMSNTLAPDQIGWDWMGLMLKDGRSLTVFRLRNADGTSSFVSATIFENGESRAIPQSEIVMTPSNEYTSPTTKGRYPQTWRVHIPSQGIDLLLHARANACEIGEGASGTEPHYWEGPVATADESAIGYLEMTGYVGRVTL